MKRLLFLIILLPCLLAKAANVAPVVFSSTNYQVVLPRTATLAALVTDDGLPTGLLTNQWSFVSGPGSVTFSNAAATITDAAFSAPGNYVLSLVASDGSLSSTQQTWVTVYASPINLHLMFSGTGSGTVNGYSSNFTLAYASSSSVTLTSTPAAGSSFIEWVGSAYTGTNNPCTVTVDQTKDITAIFDVYACATNLFYVDIAGNDSASGRSGSPWLTITNAAAKATNGCRVIVGAGTWTNAVTVANTGTNAPIVFEGTRDTNGNWLTIIDPSTPVSSGWVSSGYASNTYELSGLSFDPKEMEIDGKRVAYTFTNGIINTYLGGSVSTIYWYYPSGTAIIQASNLFNMGSNDMAYGYSSLLTDPVRFWDGLEALYTTFSNAPGSYTCYLKFRDGSSPNGKNITVSPNVNGLIVAPGSGGNAVNLTFNPSAQTNIYVRNFWLRGSFCQIELGNGGDGNVAENNYLTGGWGKVLITGSASVGGHRSSGNIIRNNLMQSLYYGYDDGGAWNELNDTEYRYRIRELVYGNFKYNMGHGGTFDESVHLFNAGINNQIYGNHIIQSGGDGIWLYTTAAPASTNTVIWDNLIENGSSTGMLLTTWHANSLIHDNRVSDCDINFRLGLLDQPGETNRSANIFRNVSWLPFGAGEHFFFHWNTSTPNGFWPTYWIYHNSMSGGYSDFEWNANAISFGGTPNFRMLNNVLSAPSFNALLYFPSDFETNTTYVGACDYNVMPSHVAIAWLGAGNIVSASQYANTPAMSFVLTNGSVAINAALDTSSSFTLSEPSGTNTFSALPDTATKVGSGWDMGALERPAPTGGTLNAVTLRVGNATFY